MREKFKKIGLSALTLLLTLSTLTLFASAATDRAAPFPDGATPTDVILDGQQILKGEAVIINSTTYVPLRKFSEIAGAEKVSWNAQTKTAAVTVDGGEW